jgi:hypothetical protein
LQVRAANAGWNSPGREYCSIVIMKDSFARLAIDGAECATKRAISTSSSSLRASIKLRNHWLSHGADRRRRWQLRCLPDNAIIARHFRTFTSDHFPRVDDIYEPRSTAQGVLESVETAETSAADQSRCMGRPSRSSTYPHQTQPINRLERPSADYSPVWSSISASGALFLTDSIPLSADCLRS